MKLLKYIPLQLVFFLILGILVANYFPITQIMAVYLLLSCFGLFSFTFYLNRRKLREAYNFTVASSFIFIAIGIMAVSTRNQQLQTNHYSYVVKNKDRITFLRIKKVLKSSKNYYKYTAKVLAINGQQTKGTVLLGVYKDGAYEKLEVDQKILISEPFKKITPALNPGQFDYKKFLSKQQIYHQIYLQPQEIYRFHTGTKSIRGLAAKLRNTINTALLKVGLKGDELAIVNALLLGQRQELSKELLENYQNAGAVHILAVSGLHVGIILWLLHLVLKPLEQSKHGRLIKLLLTVISLWFFALIAGLSPSVVRAVTMYTAVAIALATRKAVNTYKTLIISIFFLLLFHPDYLYDVGFQLSYLAVFFIVWLQPLLRQCWKPRWKILDYYWQLLTVSFAAQIGVLPLSLYYFHQFPGLFFLSNLLIIPFLGLLLGLGILVISLALLNILPKILATFYSGLIFLLNELINWIAQQESFLFQNISFNLNSLVISYLLIFFIFKWFEFRRYNYTKLMLLLFLLFQVNLIIQKYSRQTSDEFVIFNHPRATLMAIKTGDKIIVHHNIQASTDTIPSIKAYLREWNHRKKIVSKELSNVYTIKKEFLVVIDSLGVYKAPHFKPTFLLLSKSPKINLDRVLKNSKPQFVIADASNYKNRIPLWAATCKKHNIKFHYTAQDGSFIKKL